MPSNIPTEAAQKMADFNREQALIEASRPRKEKFDKNKPQVEKKRQWTRDQLEDLARANNCRLVDNGGKHEKVYDSEGHLITEIPKHKGNIPIGTAQSICERIRNRIFGK